MIQSALELQTNVREDVTIMEGPCYSFVCTLIFLETHIENKVHMKSILILDFIFYKYKIIILLLCLS